MFLLMLTKINAQYKLGRITSTFGDKHAFNVLILFNMQACANIVKTKINMTLYLGKIYICKELLNVEISKNEQTTE